MFTVTLGFESSGNSSTRRPLGKAYSVIPSAAVTLRTPSGRVCAQAIAANNRAMTGSTEEGNRRIGTPQCEIARIILDVLRIESLRPLGSLSTGRVATDGTGPWPVRVFCSYHSPVTPLEKVARELQRYDHPLFEFAAREKNIGIELVIHSKAPMPGSVAADTYTASVHLHDIERAQFPWAFQRYLYAPPRLRG